MAYLSAMREVSDQIPIFRFNGVYKPCDDGFHLPDNLFTKLINFAPDIYPAITTRPGYAVIGSFETTVLGLSACKDLELHTVFNVGTSRTYNGS